eukprot:CAMPEP_0173417204 /NCGR_PEP_ID=MMETSP1356-20130122/85781_1 /TAXON_ID=77927 ORGANISM="Hemiselmis virescens, Strain PCC157" /NCGR_SAMPLE_ID=MMETSP1356 /ASSEMBLY_ACC=CAM_ASM_000847 /LENGTH=44 /DNA_ID= /DNA_START= /DNA_END= /DNA_ORIENTATION=
MTSMLLYTWLQTLRTWAKSDPEVKHGEKKRWGYRNTQAPHLGMT